MTLYNEHNTHHFTIWLQLLFKRALDKHRLTHIESASVATTSAKTTTRTRKTSAEQTADSTASVIQTASNLQIIIEAFQNLIHKISQDQIDFEKLQSEISQTKQAWDQEKKNHQIELTQHTQQEELDRKREKEAYEYELARSRKKFEDDIADQKAAWQKELQQQKEAIDADKQELVRLRVQVANFDTEKDKAVKEAQEALAKQLTEKFEVAKKLSDQESKAEKEMLNTKIANLAEQNARQAREIEALKKSLDEATRQVKEIAVKVIESGGNMAKSPQASEV